MLDRMIQILSQEGCRERGACVNINFDAAINICGYFQDRHGDCDSEAPLGPHYVTLLSISHFSTTFDRDAPLTGN